MRHSTPGWSGSLPLKYRVELLLLAPSGMVMKHSRAMRRFYLSQYYIAGGRRVPLD
ncbi:MAG TPA: hypothetical protein VG733_10370 [Chthoniobacteraceae bacterium]|nr:hypothetical protein [Chthoniobacteraceae bacterium]